MVVNPGRCCWCSPSFRRPQPPAELDALKQRIWLRWLPRWRTLGSPRQLRALDREGTEDAAELAISPMAPWPGPLTHMLHSCALRRAPAWYRTRAAGLGNQGGLEELSSKPSRR
jgi:hypothetical protein